MRDIASGRIVLGNDFRSALYPDQPTLDEAGLKGFNLDAWAGLVAPAGTPAHNRPIP
jgi:tripartite-type tricarboxylate transporter receptor subunit TctC